MWYASLMPNQLPDKALKEAAAAVDNADRVRKFHARRTETDSPQRAEDIDIALARLKDAMRPLRSQIGQFPYGPQTDEAEVNRERIREASQAIQTERRKLWKMRRK